MLGFRDSICVPSRSNYLFAIIALILFLLGIHYYNKERHIYEEKERGEKEEAERKEKERKDRGFWLDLGKSGWKVIKKEFDL